MSGRTIGLVAALAAVAVLCGCVGYFHYNPVKSMEQTKAAKGAEKIFPSGSLGAPVAPAISAVPVTDEELLKEGSLIK